MAVKYSCTKCGKRFVDWGAEKIKSGEGCSDCKGEFLELAGFNASKTAVKKKPALKRKRRAAAVAAPPDDAESGPDAQDAATDGADESTEDIGEAEESGPKTKA